MESPAIPLVDIRAQYATMSEQINAAIARVVESGRFVLGEEAAGFEREFAEYCGAPHCVGCASGTDALKLALQAVGVVRGDEVITVAHTFMATASSIVELGAKPVFVDVRDDTLLMDTRLVEAAITERTRAIVPVHLYGQTVDMDPLVDLARRRGIKVVEDAAQAHGARYKQRRAGGLADAAAFSFYPGKNLGAYGDAGAVTTNDDRAAAWLRQARDHGRVSRYEHGFVAGNSRLDSIQAAVLRVKLARLDEWNERRRQLAADYDAALPVASVSVHPDCESVYHLYVVRMQQRDEALTALAAAGISGGVHYPIPVHKQPAMAGVDAHLPVTERAATEILSLPIYAELPEGTAERVANALGALR